MAVEVDDIGWRTSSDRTRQGLSIGRLNLFDNG
jgi:hypothetical protein